MKSYLIKLVIILLICIITSCEKWFWQHDKLHLEKRLYNGSELRIDGYFYNLDTVNDIMSIYFLYQNGVFRYVGSKETDSISNIENNFKYYIERYHWGLYNIDSNKIIYEKWVPMGPPVWAYTYEGEILNDTTFVIKETYRLKYRGKTDVSSVNWVYHFKQFSPKPDSTNNFVK